MKKTTILALVLLLSLGLSQFVLAIGQMTKPIILKDVLRGQEVTARLTLYNSGEEEETYGLKAEGDVADWATFYNVEDENLENPITEVSIPVKSQLKAIVKFSVPQDAPNGEYPGQVLVMTTLSEEEREEEGARVNVMESIGREVLITVTDKEIIDIETTIIPSKYDFAKKEPLKIKVIYYNKGNVALKPSIQLKVVRGTTNDIVSNVIYPFPEDKEAVKPLERRTFPALVEWQTTGQESGKYRAEISVLYNNKVIGEDDFKFSIGLVSKNFLAAVSLLGGGNLTLGWFVIAGILLIIAAVLIVIDKKYKYSNNLIKKINL